MSFLLYLIVGFGFNSISADSNYVVMYKHEIYKVDEAIKFPKVPVPEEFKGALGKDSLDIHSYMQWPVTVMIEMRVNTKGEYTYKQFSENPANGLLNNKVRYFQNGKYFTGDESAKEEPLRFLFKKIHGTRNILGFPCEQFQAIDQTTKKEFEIWATKKLPQSITGFHRMPQFGYAVLEIKSLEGFWKTTATSIMAFDKNENVFSANLFDAIVN